MFYWKEYFVLKSNRVNVVLSKVLFKRMSQADSVFFIMCCYHVFMFLIFIYLLRLKKSSPFVFLWLIGQVLTNFNNIWWYCSVENLQTNDLFLSYNIQFMYEYFTIEKQEIFCMLLPLGFAIMPVYCSFFKSLFSPHSLQLLFRNSLISFFCSITFENVQIFY